MTRIRMLAVVLSGVTLLASPGEAQTFEVVALGTLPGSSWSSAEDINDRGQIAGRSGNSGDRLFLWEPSTGMRDLNVPNPTAISPVVRMNSAGHIAGVWVRDGANRPFLWNGSAFTELPDPAPDWVRGVGRLTDEGMVLYEGPDAACNRMTAVLFAGTIYHVDQVLGSCWTARDIADGPVVAGYRVTSGGYQAAVRAANGQVTVPSSLPGGQVMRLGPGGYVIGGNGNLTRMFITGPSGASVEFTPLPGSAVLSPWAINRFGEAVGNAHATGVADRSFIVRNGQLRELTSLIAGYTISFLTDINDQGDIVGRAVVPGGQRQAVLLRPTDKPGNLAATVVGNQVTLTWTPPVGAPSGVTYLLLVGSSSGATNVFSANVGAGTTIGGVVPNGTYYARLAMVYPDGAFGATSEERQFSVPSAPPAPTELAYTLNDGTLTLSWTPPPGGGVEYIVEAGSSSGGTDIYNASVGTVSGITAPVPRGTYFIRVRARNAGGVSPPSNEVVVVVP